MRSAHRPRRSSEAGRAPSSRSGLRLIVLGALVFASVLLLFSPSRVRTLVALLVPMATLVVFAVWWLREPSLTRRAKRVGVGIGLVAACFLAVAPSFPANVIALLWGLPASVALMFVAVSSLRAGASSIRRLAVGAALVASLMPWALLRSDGASGQMMPNLFWVWRTPVRGVAVEAVTSASRGRTTPLAVTAADWPGLRGGQRDGVVPPRVAAELDLDWSDGPPKECWRRIVGPGWSSFAAVGDLVCTQDQAGELERVVCLNAHSGRTAWVHSDRVRFEELAGGPGPRATPLIDDGRLYALGASGLLNCLDARSGRPIWSADISGGDDTPEWGFASSPLIHGDLVYVSPAGSAGVRMLALDRQTGEPVWQDGGAHSGYASAQFAVLAGTPQVLLFDGGGLVGYEPNTGERLWEHVWITGQPMAAQPHVAAGDSVIIGMGYGRGTRSLHVTRSGREWSARERWTTSRLKPKFNDFVVNQGHLFGLDEGILVCIDASTGERVWKGGRYGYGQLLLVGETLLIVTESGELVLVEASAAGHNELARAPALSGKSWSHPALARGRLFVRNGAEAACFDLRASVGPS